MRRILNFYFNLNLLFSSKVVHAHEKKNREGTAVGKFHFLAICQFLKTKCLLQEKAPLLHHWCYVFDCFGLCCILLMGCSAIIGLFDKKNYLKKYVAVIAILPIKNIFRELICG